MEATNRRIISQLAEIGREYFGTLEVEEEGGTAFFVTIPKEAARLSKFAGEESGRPAIEQIYLDVKRSALVATDTQILAEYPAEVEGSEAISEGSPAIFIDPKHIKNLIGRCRVQLIERREGVRKRFTAIFTNEAGEVYKNELSGRCFPDYRKIYPSVTPGGYIQCSSDAVKQFAKFIRAINKCAGDEVLEISTEEGATSVRIKSNQFCDDAREINLSLACAAPLSCRFGLRVRDCAGVIGSWSGGIWFNEPGSPMILDSLSARIILIMPKNINNPLGKARGVFCDALSRAESVPGVDLPRKVKTASNRKKSSVFEKKETVAPAIEVAEEKKTKESEIKPEKMPAKVVPVVATDEIPYTVQIQFRFSTNAHRMRLKYAPERAGSPRSASGRSPTVTYPSRSCAHTKRGDPDFFISNKLFKFALQKFY